jgi:proline iminopeptidase
MNRRLFALIGGFAVVASAVACGPRAASRPTAEATPDSGTVAVDNASIPYLIEGAGRPCLVFGSRIYYPRTFSPTFKQRLRCAHVDQRGFIADAAAPTAGPYTIAAAVRDVETVRQALKLERFVLIGHSMHGTVALAYALAHPERVEAVIAIGSPPALDSSLMAASAGYWERQATAGRNEAHRQSRALLPADSLARLTSGQAFIANYVANRALYWADSSFDAAPLWAGMSVNLPLVFQLFDFTNPYRLRGTGGATPPALIVLGRFDFVVPPTLWDGVETPFDRMTVAVLERSGHTPQLEEPEAFDSRVIEWLDSVAPR